MKAKAYSTLQKTYDQSHLICSTAVYYESQGNDDEALRCWRECLSQLRGHNTAGYRPCTETERTLLHSLKTMQDHCQEKVDILQTMLTSKKNIQNNQMRNTGGNLEKIDPTKSLPTECATPSPTPPALPERPHPPRASTAMSPSSLGVYSTRSFHSIRTIPLVGVSGLSRTPNPEKRAFLSTLRSSKKEKKTVKAAALAWNSLSRAEGESFARSLSVPLADNVHHTRNHDGASASTSDLPNSLHITSYQQRSLPSLIPPKGVHRSYDAVVPLGNSGQPSLGPLPPPPPPHKCPIGRSLTSSHESPMGLGDVHTSKHYHQLDLGVSVPITSTTTTASAATTATTTPELNLLKSSVKRSMITNVNSPLPRKPVHHTLQIASMERNNQRNLPILKDDLHQTSSQQFGQILERENDTYSAGNTSQETVSQDDAATEQGNRIANALKMIGKGVDMQAALQVANEIVIQGDEVKWDDIAGLDAAKLALKEAVVYPFLRPDLFSGLREPLGESEKLVRALFALAKALAPSIIFVDEIDSLLSSRNGSGEHEATRRIKTEFLIQWSDLTRAAAGNDTKVGDASRVLVLAATNLPWAIDDAARRRFVRRQYIPLPEGSTREKQLLRLLSNQKYKLNHEEMEHLVRLTDGFSGSDLTALAKDAAMGPLRSLGEALLQMQKDDIRPITFSDFEASLTSIRPSVSKEGLQLFEDWSKKYGEQV
ncbi:AAA-domain-containing protein [Morchella conica CCBAS932]|uniref:AAA-domain-containing protein n=1 Tax=Morchella conica CCBAS932 TaxID=1392247 RepID=A0A3N4L8E1_9PEZI|nr:AAA-domain-containing protein [Morchella conica CCBAS932]